MDAGSDALSLINTLLGTAIDIKKRKFKLANITGGLSGPAVKPVALRCVWQVHRALPNVPLIGMGGIVNATDAIEFLLAGATAVAVGTATFVNPTAVHRPRDRHRALFGRKQHQRRERANRSGWLIQQEPPHA